MSNAVFSGIWQDMRIKLLLFGCVVGKLLMVQLFVPWIHNPVISFLTWKPWLMVNKHSHQVQSLVIPLMLQVSIMMPYYLLLQPYLISFGSLLMKTELILHRKGGFTYKDSAFKIMYQGNGVATLEANPDYTGNNTGIAANNETTTP
ncbi:hypothetical protein G9A89_006179 [Geosiphon pyriformis]|nr:hypothetical protein G9A89_006179 [Geosiphon pyriformis]